MESVSISNLAPPYFSYLFNSRTPNSEPRRAHLALSLFLGHFLAPPPRLFAVHIFIYLFWPQTSLGLRSRSPFDLATCLGLRLTSDASLPSSQASAALYGGEGKKLQHACADQPSRGTSVVPSGSRHDINPHALRNCRCTPHIWIQAQNGASFCQTIP